MLTEEQLDRLKGSPHWQTLKGMGMTEQEVEEVFTAPVPVAIPLENRMPSARIRASQVWNETMRAIQDSEKGRDNGTHEVGSELYKEWSMLIEILEDAYALARDIECKEAAILNAQGLARIEQAKRGELDD